MTIYVACFIAFFIWFRPSQEKVHYNKCLCTEFKDQIIIILMSHIEIYSVCINQSEERQILLHTYMIRVLFYPFSSVGFFFFFTFLFLSIFHYAFIWIFYYF